MNDLKVFSSSEFGELGIMLIDGREYFPATRCAIILGYKNPQEAIRKHCKGVRELLTPTAGGIQSVKYIPEGDLYRLIISSRLPAAEKFERWVFDEVLPGIRRNGGYSVPGSLTRDDIEKLVTETAAEVVCRVVPAVVSEIMKNMVPAVPGTITKDAPKEPDDSGCCSKALIPGNGKTIIEKPDRSKIAKLPPDVRAMVENMLIQGHTGIEISTFISDVSGVSVSVTSVHRYKDRHFEVRK